MPPPERRRLKPDPIPPPPAEVLIRGVDGGAPAGDREQKVREQREAAERQEREDREERLRLETLERNGRRVPGWGEGSVQGRGVDVICCVRGCRRGGC